MNTPVEDGTSCSDGVFCNGEETCQGGACTDGPEPCVDPEHCDEAGQRCYECIADGECDDDNVCTEDACIDNECAHTPDDALCDNGVFCDGVETCDIEVGCVAGAPPCTEPELPYCDEDGRQCVECLLDEHCPDDGLFCTGEPVCQEGVCDLSGDPCVDGGLYCDEAARECVSAPVILHIFQDNGAVRGGKDNVNPDGTASIAARSKGITVCTITFSQDVDVTLSDIEVRNAEDTADEAPPATFGYDPATYTVTLTWDDGTFSNQWVRINVLDRVRAMATGAGLDGEIFAVAGDPSSGLALDGEIPSGDGSAGGTASFVLGALMGDVTGNRLVNITDRGTVQQYIGLVCPEADLPSDITGNCIINITDRGRVQQNIGARLPALP